MPTVTQHQSALRGPDCPFPLSSLPNRCLAATTADVLPTMTFFHSYNHFYSLLLLVLRLTILHPSCHHVRIQGSHQTGSCLWDATSDLKI